jgi:hypothetical protein
MNYVYWNILNVYAVQADGLRVSKNVACKICIVMCISISIRCIETENSDANAV